MDFQSNHRLKKLRAQHMLVWWVMLAVGVTAVPIIGDLLSLVLGKRWQRLVSRWQRPVLLSTVSFLCALARPVAESSRVTRRRLAPRHGAERRHTPLSALYHRNRMLPLGALLLLGDRASLHCAQDIRRSHLPRRLHTDHVDERRLGLLLLRGH